MVDAGKRRFVIPSEARDLLLSCAATFSGVQEKTDPSLRSG